MLVVLYALQAVPVGLTAAIPLLMYKSSDAKQSWFHALVSYPLCLALLIAPVAQGVCSLVFGPRKTWLAQTQVVIGLVLLVGSNMCSCLTVLASVCALLSLLVTAHQGAVDALALPASAVCRTIGHTLGIGLSHSLPLALLPLGAPPAALAPYLGVFGSLFLASAAAAFLFLKAGTSTSPPPSLRQQYGGVWRAAKLPAVRSLGVVLLTGSLFSGIGASSWIRMAVGSIPLSGLGLLGMVLLSPPPAPAEGPKPLSQWLSLHPLRLANSAALLVLVALTSILGPGLPIFVLLAAAAIATRFVSTRCPTLPAPRSLPRAPLHASHACLSYCPHPPPYRHTPHSFFRVDASLSAFLASVADAGSPAAHLLAVLAQLGRGVPASLFFLLDGYCDLSECVPKECPGIEPPLRASRNPLLAVVFKFFPRKTTPPAAVECGCEETMVLDGFYSVGAVSLALGVVWLVYMHAHVIKVQGLTKASWRITPPLPAEDDAPRTPVPVGPPGNARC